MKNYIFPGTLAILTSFVFFKYYNNGFLELEILKSHLILQISSGRPHPIDLPSKSKSEQRVIALINYEKCSLKDVFSKGFDIKNPLTLLM